MVVSSIESIISTIWKETPAHFLIEVLLVLFVIILILRKPEYIHDPNSDLTEQEENEIIRDWKPKPLIPDKIPEDSDLSIINTHNVTSGPGIYVEIDEHNCLNFGTTNFFGLNMDERIIDASLQAIDKYAVGACGPRQFYGTMDAHLNFEKDLAEWVGCEDTVNYCYPFATTSSLVWAFVRNSDICFVDDGCWFAIHFGAQLARAKIVFYRHNDLEDLKNSVTEWKGKFTRWRKVNRWVVTEGIF